jgi:hypothetical protein
MRFLSAFSVPIPLHSCSWIYPPSQSGYTAYSGSNTGYETQTKVSRSVGLFAAAVGAAALLYKYKSDVNERKQADASLHRVMAAANHPPPPITIIAPRPTGYPPQLPVSPIYPEMLRVDNHAAFGYVPPHSIVSPVCVHPPCVAQSPVFPIQTSPQAAHHYETEVSSPIPLSLSPTRLSRPTMSSSMPTGESPGRSRTGSSHSIVTQTSRGRSKSHNILVTPVLTNSPSQGSLVTEPIIIEASRSDSNHKKSEASSRARSRISASIRH